jgi:hypothetical protein
MSAENNAEIKGALAKIEVALGNAVAYQQGNENPIAVRLEQQYSQALALCKAIRDKVPDIENVNNPMGSEYQNTGEIVVWCDARVIKAAQLMADICEIENDK